MSINEKKKYLRNVSYTICYIILYIRVGMCVHIDICSDEINNKKKYVFERHNDG